MRVLAIDTATTALVTGVVDTESGQITQRVLADTRAHNERLMPTILEVMSEAGLELDDLDAIVAGMGPGPFTGLRVGMATAQALADALVWPLLMWHMLGIDNKGIPHELLDMAILVRDGFIIAMAVIVLRQMWNKTEDKVRAAHMGRDPVAGVFQ